MAGNLVPPARRCKLAGGRGRLPNFNLRLACGFRVNRGRRGLVKNYRKFDAIFTTGESRGKCMTRLKSFGDSIRRRRIVRYSGIGMSTFARDRRSPAGLSAARGSLAEFAVGHPQRRAFDLIENIEVLRRAPTKPSNQPLTPVELNAAEALMRIARSMAPSLDEIRLIARRYAIAGSDAELLRNPEMAELVAERFPYKQPDRAACRAYFEAHPEEFRGTDLYEGGEILLAGDVTDRDWRSDAYGRAERIIAMLYYDRRIFSDLLVTSAASPDARGVRIGPVACGAWGSEVAAPFFSLKAGEVFPLPVPSRQGFHVLLMERILAGRMRPFAEVEGDVVRRLAMRSRLAAAWHHLESLAV
jgi:peptidyl-prolyl cis-trans isomerase C